LVARTADSPLRKEEELFTTEALRHGEKTTPKHNRRQKRISKLIFLRL
jgi:hypothetical protein